VSGSARALAAMARANMRYWPTVLPRVQKGLRAWEGAAGRIPDDRLRQIALAKLDEERFNTEVAATLATLAPRRQRAAAIDAIVPLQVRSSGRGACRARLGGGAGAPFRRPRHLTSSLATRAARVASIEQWSRGD
jgi:hypothetical protein